MWRAGRTEKNHKQADYQLSKQNQEQTKDASGVKSGHEIVLARASRD